MLFVNLGPEYCATALQRLIYTLARFSLDVQLLRLDLYNSLTGTV